jgi:hypothetical protein
VEDATAEVIAQPTPEKTPDERTLLFKQWKCPAADPPQCPLVQLLNQGKIIPGINFSYIRFAICIPYN